MISPDQPDFQPNFQSKETPNIISPLIVNTPADLPSADVVTDVTTLFTRVDEHRRVDLEGHLTTDQVAGMQILRLNDGELSEVLGFHLAVLREDTRRDFGRVRITVERISE